MSKVPHCIYILQSTDGDVTHHRNQEQYVSTFPKAVAPFHGCAESAPEFTMLSQRGISSILFGLILKVHIFDPIPFLLGIAGSFFADI